LKRIIQLFSKLAEEDQEKFEKLQSIYGTIIKLGAVESTSHREKLSNLARFTTNQRNMTSLDQVYSAFSDTVSNTNIYTVSPLVCGEPQERSKADLLPRRLGQES
jgi:HSP90 family molecular chaperone